MRGEVVAAQECSLPDLSGRYDHLHWPSNQPPPVPLIAGRARSFHCILTVSLDGEQCGDA
jgi:hypothetical protein